MNRVYHVSLDPFDPFMKKEDLDSVSSNHFRLQENELTSVTH